MAIRPLLASFMRRWGQGRRAARVLVVTVLLVLLGVAAWSLAALVPQRHVLTISGTDITSHRHFFAAVLQEQA